MVLGGPKDVAEVAEGRIGECLRCGDNTVADLELEYVVLLFAVRDMHAEEGWAGITLLKTGKTRALPNDRMLERGEPEVGGFQPPPQPSLRAGERPEV